MKKIFKNKNGYTLLFAVLVSSIVLSVGISILKISKKEFLLASSARESLSAFYAADSGIECAMYWDSDAGGALATTTVGINSISCGNHDANSPLLDISVPNYLCSIDSGYETCTTAFDVSFGSGNSCAKINITKVFGRDNNLGMDIQHTKIESRGYNIGWNGSSCSAGSPKRVERALRMSY
jgi:hypothetical protein